MELRSFVIDVDLPGGRTLVSRRRADGVLFTEDPATGRLRTASGLCVHSVRRGKGTTRTIPKLTLPYNDRFVKQEQWERWQAKRKLISGSASEMNRGINPRRIWRLYAQNPAIQCILVVKWFAMPLIMRS